MSWASRSRSRALGVSSSFQLSLGLVPVQNVRQQVTWERQGPGAIPQRIVSSVVGHGGGVMEASLVEEFGSRCGGRAWPG